MFNAVSGPLRAKETSFDACNNSFHTRFNSPLITFGRKVTRRGVRVRDLAWFQEYAIEHRLALAGRRVKKLATALYLKNMRPRTVRLYSAASLMLRSLITASQSLASKPWLAETRILSGAGPCEENLCGLGANGPFRPSDHRPQVDIKCPG